jgi:hypothetical protein
MNSFCLLLQSNPEKKTFAKFPKTFIPGKVGRSQQDSYYLLSQAIQDSQLTIKNSQLLHDSLELIFNNIVKTQLFLFIHL